MLLIVAVLFVVVAAVGWWWPFGWRLPRLGWAGTEQASWLASVLGAVFALASFIFDRRDARPVEDQRPPPLGGLVQVGRVPPQAAWFQDRHTRIDLAKAATAGRTAVLTQVLSGMGGVGKTQLAAQFTRQLTAAGELDVLVWVTASSRDAIIAAYAETARELCLADNNAAPEAAAGRLMGWLERTHQCWLIVLDNLDAPADASGWWPPDNPNGRTIATTRRRDAVLHTDGRALVTVDLFTAGESIGYLTRAIGERTPRTDVELLAEDLGHLPIAVAQAAAFIRDRGLDCAIYRQRLTDRKHRLTDLLPHDDALPDDHRTTVVATWSLSIEAANDAAPRGLARPVLTIAAMLDPNNIPAALFTAESVPNYLTTNRDSDSTVPPAAGERAAVDTLHNLHRLNLITHDPQAGTVRVHALVQRATREQIAAGELTAAAHAAADALLDIWPAIERDPVHGQILRANITALRQNTGDILLIPSAHRVLFRAGQSLGETGLVRPAITAYEQLLTDELRVLGPDHPDTLTTRHHLARWRAEAGDPAGAAIAYEQLLTDELRVLGPDHPDTLTTRHHLARWWGEAGDANGAATALHNLLNDQMRVLGPDHPDTLTTRGFLAFWRGRAGDAAGAVIAYEQLLPDQLRVLGHDHPDILITRGNLAQWRREAGDTVGAATDMQDLLNDKLRVFGPDHPHTLAARGMLARWRGEGGDTAGAVTDLLDLLVAQLQVLGPDHPDSLTTRNNLAHWRAQAGDADRSNDSA